MRYYLDSEFIEDGKTIDLISIGIVAEDGREFYAINYDCDFERANDWVKENVLSHLPEKPLPFIPDSTGQGWQSKDRIRHEVAKFCGCEFVKKEKKEGEGFTVNKLGRMGRFWEWETRLKKDTSKPEFWADYASYDWVVFCQLFGTMMDLPAGFPMYCNDIQQLRHYLGYGDIEPPKQHGTAHNALEDARYVQELWDFYNNWTDENINDGQKNKL